MVKAEEVEEQVARYLRSWPGSAPPRNGHGTNRRSESVTPIWPTYPNEYPVIMHAGETLARFETLWSTGTAFEKKKLLRSAERSSPPSE
jgi:hypothetical protein